MLEVAEMERPTVTKTKRTAAVPSENCWRRVPRDAALITLIASAVALSTNAVRSRGIPIVAHTDFEILVPCPEPIGTAAAISALSPLVHQSTTLLIDSRTRSEYQSWHLPAAINVPFDWLAEQDEVTKQAREVAKSVAHTRKHAVVIYGDGGDPDSGHQWAALLSTAGIKNVSYVTGGAAALGAPNASKEAP